MMRFKNMLKCFSKTEVQEDERFSLAPMREREELLCERSELSNSGEGYISSVEHTVTVFSPFTSHFSQLCLPSPDATRHPLPGEGNKFSCEEHTEKNLFTYLPIHLFTFKKAAFTLAEVLITLAIIGVVAAITIPNLISKYQEKATVVRLTTTYIKLLESFRVMVEENGTIDTYGITAEEREQKLVELLPHYIKGLEICKKHSDCFGAYKNKYSDSTLKLGNFYGTGKDFRMPDGTTIKFYRTSVTNCTQNMAMNNGYWGSYQLNCGYLYVDLNGLGGPNTNDKDLFAFVIVKDGIVPAGNEKEGVWTQRFDQQCLEKKPSLAMGYCSAWVIKNKNMDYLRCRDLSWTGKTKCSE